jgi:hypothetical protein
METEKPTHKALSGKIRQAREAVQSGDIVFLKPAIIAADLLELECEAREVPVILAELLAQITPVDYVGTRPPQRSYEEDLMGCELYAFRTASKRLGCEVYFKFALFEERLWLVSFHADRLEGGD